LRNVDLRRIIARVSESERTATAKLEVDLHGATPEGALIAADGLRRTFSGWIELASAIEDWRRMEAEDPANAENVPRGDRAR
jgi:hypothetical protein